MWNGYGVCSNVASSGEPPTSHDHFNHCSSAEQYEHSYKSGPGTAVYYFVLFRSLVVLEVNKFSFCCSCTVTKIDRAVKRRQRGANSSDGDRIPASFLYLNHS